MQHSPRLKTVGTWVLGSSSPWVPGSSVYSLPTRIANQKLCRWIWLCGSTSLLFPLLVSLLECVCACVYVCMCDVCVCVCMCVCVWCVCVCVVCVCVCMCVHVCACVCGAYMCVLVCVLGTCMQTHLFYVFYRYIDGSCQLSWSFLQTVWHPYWCSCVCYYSFACFKWGWVVQGCCAWAKWISRSKMYSSEIDSLGVKKWLKEDVNPQVKRTLAAL